MIDELNREILKYQQKWQGFTAKRQDKAFFEAAKPTAIGWKTTDLAEFDKMMPELREHCDQIHLGWVNERWLATLHLRDLRLEWGIQVIKLMQRRPGSSDPVGLDHIDFYTKDLKAAEAVLSADKGIKWSPESNNPHCSWLSIWFDDTEAKLRDSTVLDVCIAELKETNDRILPANQ